MRRSVPGGDPWAAMGRRRGAQGPRRRPVGVLAAVAALAATLLVGAGLVGTGVDTGVVTLAAPGAPAECRDVTLFAVNGAGAAGGDTLAAVTDPLVQQVGPRLAVVAVPGPEAGASYAASEQQAATALADQVAAQVAGCPGSRVMLFGYSQGAHVAGDVASRIGSGRETRVPADRVVAVGLFGDPARDAAARTVPAGVTGQGVFPARPGGFGSLRSRTIEVCAPQDPVCATPAGATPPPLEQAVAAPAHIDYPQLTVAADTPATRWASESLGRLVSALPPAETSPAGAAPAGTSSAAPTGLPGAGTVAPGTTAPGTSTPGTTAPGTTAPGTTAPGTTAPDGADGAYPDEGGAGGSPAPTGTTAPGGDAGGGYEEPGGTGSGAATPTRAPGSGTGGVTPTSAPGSAGSGTGTAGGSGSGGSDGGSTAGSGQPRPTTPPAEGPASRRDGGGTGRSGGSTTAPRSTRAPGSSATPRSTTTSDAGPAGSTGSTDSTGSTGSTGTTGTTDSADSTGDADQDGGGSGGGTAGAGGSGAGGSTGQVTNALWSLTSGLAGFQDSNGGNVEDGGRNPAEVDSPNVPGRRVVKLEVPDGAKRSEVRPEEAQDIRAGQHLFFGYSAFLPADFPVDTRSWQVVWQLHDGGTNTSPPVALEIVDGRLWLSNVGDRVRDLGPVQAGRNLAVQMDIQFEEGGGAVSVYREGQRVLNGFRPPRGTMIDSFDYLKTGIYRDPAGDARPAELFLNDLKIGETLESVSGLAGAAQLATTDGGAAADDDGPGSGSTPEGGGGTDASNTGAGTGTSSRGRTAPTRPASSSGP